MQRAFEKIIEKLSNKRERCEDLANQSNFDGYAKEEAEYLAMTKMCDNAIEIVNQVASEYCGGWIPVEERLPEVETEVLIHARRKYTGGYFKDIITTAMYEDGTVREDDSCWRWEDVDGEWDEERDCLIIPEGWWENKHYNPDGELNYAVDDKVIEWMPLPEPSKFKFECANPSSPELIKELNEKLRKI